VAYGAGNKYLSFRDTELNGTYILDDAERLVGLNDPLAVFRYHGH
jgi:hypothetical protein